MSGHSKWNNIKRKKGASDAARAKIFTKVAREISVAVKEGGPDPASNGKLRDCIAKAKACNMPNDNIDRCIKKAAGSDNKDSYEEIVYEGYGPCGVAVIVETLTDNRNRTAGDLRHYFDKCGGNLGQNGCVSFLFTQSGLIIIDDPDGELDEEKVMEDALDCGAADFEADGGIFEITTEPDDFNAVTAALEAKGYVFAEAAIEMVPQNYIKLTSEEDIKNMTKMIDLMEDNDDVQNVWHNWEQD